MKILKGVKMDRMTSKQELLESLKTLNANSSELEKQKFIDKLNNLIDSESKDWIKLVGENQENIIDDEIFKPAWHARNCGELWYYASNYGRVILTPKNAEEIKIKSFKNIPLLKIKNGYLTSDKFNVALYTDVYVFVTEAFWEEFSDEYETLKRNFPNKVLELHHINNNPNDNRLGNLIYLPNSIHSYVKKI